MLYIHNLGKYVCIKNNQQTWYKNKQHSQSCFDINITFVINVDKCKPHLSTFMFVKVPDADICLFKDRN